MKTGIIYARYSSERQTEQSIDGQLRICTEYAERNGIVIVDTYIDRATTGTNDNRNAFQRMLKDSNKQAWDIVLVYKLDRFSRNKYEMAMHRKTLRDNGIKLVSAMENIPDSPEGIILESLLEGMAEYYSAELSQKVRRGMNESRHKGNFTGGYVLYGYKIENKKVLIDEDKAEVVRYIYNQYAAGVYVKDIIASLTARGILNRGKPFAKNTVYNILSNEKYSGVYRYKDEVFTNIYPRIVPERVFEIVREKIAENHYGKHDSNVVYLLKNKIRCGYCGKPITSESGTAKNGSIKRYYKCAGRKLGSNCHKSVMRKDVLEQLVIDTTLNVLSHYDTIDKIAELILQAHTKIVTEQSVLNILIQEKNEKQKAIDNILTAIEKGIITHSTKKRMDELETRLEDIESKILVERSKEKSQITKEEIMRYIKTAIKKEPKQMIKMLVKEIVLFDDKMEIYFNFIDKKRPDDFDHQAFLFYSDCFDYSKFYKVKEENTSSYLINLALYG